MKKALLFTIGLLSIAFGMDAQGVNRMFGLVAGTVQSNQQSNGFLFSTDNSGQDLQIEYDFPVTTNGANPANLEMTEFNGKLYGTTSAGGESNYGTIFEYDPITDIYIKKFDFGPNLSATGIGPKGSLLLYNNKFYGLAQNGANGVGVIFEWDPSTNIYTKKYDFIAAGGASPQNSLRLMNNKMYGTTLSGGSNNVGVVFEWDPNTNVYTKLVDMTGSGAGSNGWALFSNVTPYNNKLYCMSNQGGLNNFGTLLMIDPLLPYGSNTTIIKHFDTASGGTANNNEMIVYNNKLYGCLNAGGTNFSGTLFELDPAGNVFTKLVDFNYTLTGRGPLGKLVQNGTKFLGICSEGGINGPGTIFEWDPANPTIVTKKYDFLPNNFDNTVNPGSTLAQFNSKFYAVTFNGGFVNQGNLFEYDYLTNTVTKKKTFNAAENGRIPVGRPVLLNGKIYGVCYQGPQEIFGTPYGCLWSFDPTTSIYSRKFLFNSTNNAINGRAPVSAPIAYNNKLYGTTSNGGTSDLGVLYEYDPSTDTFSKKDMQPIGGSFPIDEPIVYNDKLYGMTTANGIGNNGIVYSYDPATAVLTKVYDVQNGGSNVPNGAFTLYNNKLYGTTLGGGANNSGGVFVYDPVANTATTAAAFSGASGVNVSNAPTLYNNKLYMLANSGGANNRGSILEFDPVTNVLTTIYSFLADPGGNGFDPTGGLTVNGNFLYAVIRENNNVKVIQIDPLTGTVTPSSAYTPASNFNLPATHNGLTVFPAFIANGLANNCEAYNPVLIDGTNNNQWVPILDNDGSVVAEIKANGNNLGNVTVSLYVNNGTIRENATYDMFMDRNLTIIPQNPVSGLPVDLRLYIKSSEYETLKASQNSQSQPSGIVGMGDLAIYKNDQTCPGTLISNTIQLATSVEPYEYGYVLKAAVSGFSTFFFGKNNIIPLPISLLSFSGKSTENGNLLSWKTTNEVNFSHFEIEKSENAKTFEKIGEKPSNESNNYEFQDSNNSSTSGEGRLYRLKMVDLDGKFKYSKIINIKSADNENFSIYPNPSADYFSTNQNINFEQMDLVDLNGKTLKNFTKNSSNIYSLAGIEKGLYFLKIKISNQLINRKIVVR